MKLEASNMSDHKKANQFNARIMAEIMDKPGQPISYYVKHMEWFAKVIGYDPDKVYDSSIRMSKAEKQEITDKIQREKDKCRVKG